MPDHDHGFNDSFFPRESPWSLKHKPLVVPDRPDTQNIPVGRVSSDRDLEDAHHLLRSVINNFDPERPITKRDAENLQRDLNEIENLIYRSLR